MESSDKVYVVAEELTSRFRSKKDLNTQLTVDRKCKLFNQDDSRAIPTQLQVNLIIIYSSVACKREVGKLNK